VGPERKGGEGCNPPVVASRHGEFGAALGEAKSQVASAQAPASPGQIARIIANRFPPITRDVLLTGKNDASGLDCAQRTFSKSAYPCRNHAA
jgi:hypothetical protein